MPSLWLPILLAIVTQPASATTLTGAVRDDAGRPGRRGQCLHQHGRAPQGVGVL